MRGISIPGSVNHPVERQLSRQARGRARTQGLTPHPLPAADDAHSSYRTVRQPTHAPMSHQLESEKQILHTLADQHVNCTLMSSIMTEFTSVLTFTTRDYVLSSLSIDIPKVWLFMLGFM